MKVLLTTLNAKYIHTNLAIRLLYSLYRDKHDLSYKEFTIKENKDQVAEECSRYSIVAFSCYIWNITQTLEVCRKIKALNPSVKILLGGPEVSYDWKDVIANDFVDYIITGEGEIPFGEFLANYPHVDEVVNLVNKKDQEVKHIELTKNFDLKGYTNIMPYAYDDPEELSKKVLYVETSRGCPYKCEFCLASLDNKVRYLPDESIKATLLYVMNHGRVIKFLDRTFNIKKDFTISIFDFILANYRPENVFQFEITADILHPDIIRYINEKVPEGLFRFEIGIQSVNSKVNLEVSRKQNFEKTKNIIDQVRNKVTLHLDLIVGLPLEYWDDVKTGFEEVFKLHPEELQLGFLKFLKGTPVREKHANYGFVFDEQPPYQIIRSNFLSEEELRKITMVEDMLELYWNKGRTHHALKYVTQKTSIFNYFLALAQGIVPLMRTPEFTLYRSYEEMLKFNRDYFQQDAIVDQLLSLDYFLQYKVRPSRFANEMEKPELNAFIHELGLNHHQFRFVALPIGFNWVKWKSVSEIHESNEIVLLAYDGKLKPEIFTSDQIPVQFLLPKRQIA